MCLNLGHFSERRWTFQSERVQVSDFENPLTELQAVSPPQLIPPYRYGSESLYLQLDPPLVPLSASPQVSPCMVAWKNTVSIDVIGITDKWPDK